MKDSDRATVSSRKKAPKKRKRVAKTFPVTGIAQQYMELQRLRALVCEAESWRAMR